MGQLATSLAAFKMGQGGYLWIINATSKTLKASNVTSENMNSWSFNDIPSQSKVRFYIEFNYHLFKRGVHDSGEATFTLEGTSNSFKLLVHWPFDEGECGLKINSSSIPASDYQVFPPTLQGETYGKLGWIHDGSLSLLIMEKGITASVTTDFPGPGSIVTEIPTIPVPDCGNWMEYYSDSLGKLTLTEMTIPGTHDSGTHNPVSFVIAPYIRTQSLSLAQQLNRGIRSLDLRIGQNSPGDYIICHGDYRTSYTLAQALKEVTDFIQNTKKEIVILDFHRFVNFGEEDYDYAKLKDQIIAAVSEYILPSNFAGETLENLWKIAGHTTRRIVVAWNRDDPVSFMWPGVNQRWYGDADSLKSLYDCIESDMKTPPAGMWAACSFMSVSVSHPYTPKANAMNTDPTITNWYFGGSTFCEKANIINVDFFQTFSTVVQASIVGSLLKAAKK